MGTGFFCLKNCSTEFNEFVCKQGRLRRTDIDMRMCRALADLPSDVGLEAVDKFSAANLDGVRSKTGFIMGIIKRLQSDYPRHRPERYGK